MKAYVISVICVTLIGSVISLISPDGEGGGLSKYLKFAVGICVLAVCIAPLTSFFETMKDIDLSSLQIAQGETDNIEKFDESYTSYEVSNLKSGIKSILKDRFGIEGTECKVTVSINEKNELERIFITLYGSAIWKDSGAIEEYFSKLFGCEVITAVG